MYVELPARLSLQSLLACAWQSVASRPTVTRIVPDACVDIVWDRERLIVAGPDTHAHPHALAAGARVVGVRFAPGTASALLGVPSTALRDARVELHTLWGDAAHALSERLQGVDDGRAACDLLEQAVQVRRREAAPIDPLVRALVARLSQDAPACAEPRVAGLAAAFGVSERQLLRRASAALGYGPKLCARILRFQSFMRALREPPERSLAELAALLGYADQAHLAHDVREFAGVTPGVLRSEHRTAMSDSDKTPARFAAQTLPHVRPNLENQPAPHRQRAARAR